MGLMIHSLEGLPEGHHRDYFIYLLDYGWEEPLSDALKNNFKRMATLASEQGNAVVIASSDTGVHFSDEVLSWHNINGHDVETENLLPAILVTNRHPSEFRYRASTAQRTESNLKLVLFPLKDYCQDTGEVISLIQKIFSSIRDGKDLDDFQITRRKNAGFQGALANSLIIAPTANGTKVSYETINSYLSNV